MDPEQDYSYWTALTVRVGDLNYGGHLGNDRVLLFFHEARVRFLRVIGVSEKDIGEGVSLTQTEAAVSYFNEAFLGELLSVGVHFSSFSRVRFRVDYRILRPSDGAPIAAGHTVMAAFDYAVRRPKKIPLSFIQRVNNYQSRESGGTN